jgi:hypothetical protein
MIIMEEHNRLRDKYCDILQTFTPILPEFNSGEKSENIWERIVVLIDVSGSTNNNNGRCDRGGRGLPETDSNIENNITKPIIIAELEGVSHVLAKLANEFNITNTLFEFYSFSSNLHMVTKTNMNSTQIYSYAKNLTKYVVPEFNGKNTYTSLESVFRDVPRVPTLLCLATDGQPTDHSKDDVIELMNLVKELYVDSRLDHIIIGAGSIMKSNGVIASRTVTRKSGRNNYEDTRIEGHSECDLTFLHRLVDTSTNIGTYLPSYGDYKELLNEMNIFVECVQQDLTWFYTMYLW